MSSCHRALYTKQLSKKKKTYHDGFVAVRDRSIVLLDETGAVLAESLRVPSRRFDDDAENIDLWEGFLGRLSNRPGPCSIDPHMGLA